MGHYPVLARLSASYPGPRGRLSTRYSPVRHFTLRPKANFTFDLHVLSTPPAFVLSQDQTLRNNLSKNPKVFFFVTVIHITRIDRPVLLCCRYLVFKDRKRKSPNLIYSSNIIRLSRFRCYKPPLAAGCLFLGQQRRNIRVTGCDVKPFYGVFSKKNPEYRIQYPEENLNLISYCFYMQILNSGFWILATALQLAPAAVRATSSVSPGKILDESPRWCPARVILEILTPNFLDISHIVSPLRTR